MNGASDAARRERSGGRQTAGAQATEEHRPSTPQARASTAEALEDAIQVRVLLFARAREVAGTGEASLRVPRGATVADVARALGSEHPGLSPHLEHCSFAVNERYATREERLAEGDELAVIPPIGGG